jgi:hypothetical protein
MMHTYSVSLTPPPIYACVSYLSAMNLLFLDLHGNLFHSHILAYVSPLPVLRPGSVQVENFFRTSGNRTWAHGYESNPLEISMSSAMKSEPGLATGLTTLGALHPFICT